MNEVVERLQHHQRGTTHWEGCEEQHNDCAAILEITRMEEIIDRVALLRLDLEAENRTLRAEISELRKLLAAIAVNAEDIDGSEFFSDRFSPPLLGRILNFSGEYDHEWVKNAAPDIPRPGENDG